MYSSGRRSRSLDRLACSLLPGSPQHASGVGEGVRDGMGVRVGGSGEGVLEGWGDGVMVGVLVCVGRGEGAMSDVDKGVPRDGSLAAQPTSPRQSRIASVNKETLM